VDLNFHCIEMCWVSNAHNFTCAGLGGSSPALAMHAARPNAFMAAVLPLVLGPVRISTFVML
jgi:hypothetical protein